MGASALRTLHLFAGAGGGILADLLLGHVPVCAVEIDPYCQRVLVQRQHDGILPPFAVWDDVRTFSGGPWRGHVDVVCGGFPCQDISDAGKRQGISGARSGLWTEFARIIGEVRPRYAFIENTAALAHRGLDRVLADLAALGMDARWCCLGADDVGAPHIRKRLWILAYAQCAERGQNHLACRAGGQQLLPQRQEGAAWAGAGGQDVANAQKLRMEKQSLSAQGAVSMGHLERRSAGYAYFHGLEVGQGERSDACPQQPPLERAGWWQSEPDVGRVVDGCPVRVDKLRTLGNMQVPLVAATAWRILTL